MADTPNVPTEKPGDGRGVIRWSAVAEALTDAPPAPGGHHEAKPGVHADSLVAGHEPDKYDPKGIIMVPVVVVAITALTYVIITFTFKYTGPGTPVTTAMTQPLAVREANAPYNERATRIDSHNPNAKVFQPRLEGVLKLDLGRPGYSDEDPVFVRSFKPADSPENSPQITPQDLYPNRYVDQATGKRVLVEAEWLDKGKGVARIPVADAMKAVLGQLPAKADAKPNQSFADTPKISNGGQVTPEPAPKPADPKVPAQGHEHKAGEKHDDHEHDEKKPDDKKAPEKK